MPELKGNRENGPDNAEVCYEALASQEEVYLEEIEEKLRVSLTSYDPPPPRNSGGILAENTEGVLHWEAKKPVTEANNDPGMTTGLEELVNHAAQELITGDADDPPLSEEAVVEMLRVSWSVRRLSDLEKGIRSSL